MAVFALTLFNILRALEGRIMTDVEERLPHEGGN
jgi:hypothetical protein